MNSRKSVTTQAPPDTRNYFRWRASPAAPPIALSRDVMRNMQTAILAATQPRGPESHGLLMGYRNPESGEFVIEAFEPVEAEYRPDTSAWRERASASRSAVSPFSINRFIGIYRSQTRPGLAVSSEDCALVETLLPREEGVLLIVKPLSPEECVGAFFLCDGGAVVDEAATGREFAFEGAKPAKRFGSLAHGSAQPLWIKAVVPATAILAGIALAMMTRAHREKVSDENPVSLGNADSGSISADAPIALRAQSKGGVVQVSWNGKSPSLQGARDALLTVSDGDRTSSMRLGENELRKGSLTWNASSPNVTFQMNVKRSNAAALTEFARASVPSETINSSSVSLPEAPEPKPSPLAEASAPAGERDTPLSLESGGPLQTVRPHYRRARVRANQAFENRPQAGRTKRILGGITSKASHLWPFHSGKQE